MEPKACMVPCGLIHEERPVTQKRGHALMFEEHSGARTYSLGPRRNDWRGGGKPAFVSFGKQSVMCTCAPLISQQGSCGWVLCWG